MNANLSRQALRRSSAVGFRPSLVALTGRSNVVGAGGLTMMQSRGIVSKSPSFIGQDEPASLPKANQQYAWVDLEAKRLIAQAYQLHAPEKPFPPSLDVTSEQLEKLGNVPHYVPRNFSDRVAKLSADVLERVMGMFFREKYDHHAVTLETVAAVPGFVAAMHRHMRSLRKMQRDHGWIDPLLEESLNERMRTLWMFYRAKQFSY